MIVRLHVLCVFTFVCLTSTTPKASSDTLSVNQRTLNLFVRVYLVRAEGPLKPVNMSYNSYTHDADSPLGWKWTIDFGERVWSDGGDLILLRSDGFNMRFSPQLSDPVASRHHTVERMISALREADLESGQTGGLGKYDRYRQRLMADLTFFEAERKKLFEGISGKSGTGAFSNGTNTLIRLEGGDYVHRVDETIVRRFDAKGRLTHDYTAGGVELVLEYEGNRVSKIRRGEVVVARFTHNGPSGLMDGFAVMGGPSFRFEYREIGQKWILSGIFAEGEDGGNRRFEYDEHGNMLRCTSGGLETRVSYTSRHEVETFESGSVRRGFLREYDEDNRSAWTVWETRHEDGKASTFEVRSYRGEIAEPAEVASYEVEEEGPQAFRILAGEPGAQGQIVVERPDGFQRVWRRDRSGSWDSFRLLKWSRTERRNEDLAKTSRIVRAYRRGADGQIGRVSWEFQYKGKFNKESMRYARREAEGEPAVVLRFVYDHSERVSEIVLEGVGALIPSYDQSGAIVSVRTLVLGGNAIEIGGESASPSEQDEVARQIQQRIDEIREAEQG